jgi:hypothetical protein
MSLDLPAMHRSPRLFGLCALALALSACAGEGPVKTVAEVAGIATTPQDSKDFVVATRPADPAYIPVGTTISRQEKRKTVDEFKKMEAELEAKRVSTDAAGEQAKALGKVLPAPKPAEIPPTN